MSVSDGSDLMCAAVWAKPPKVPDPLKNHEQVELLFWQSHAIHVMTGMSWNPCVRHVERVNTNELEQTQTFSLYKYNICVEKSACHKI